MWEPASQPAPATHIASISAAQTLHAKLQKLNQDIQLQHSLVAEHKVIVLKSKKRLFYTPDRVVNDEPTEEPTRGPTGEPTEEPINPHVMQMHADTVIQHRAMLVKHNELIRQHKQMVKDQGAWVQHLSTTLLNIQQEKSVVHELVDAKILENGGQAITLLPSQSKDGLVLHISRKNNKTNSERSTSNTSTGNSNHSHLQSPRSRSNSSSTSATTHPNININTNSDTNSNSNTNANSDTHTNSSIKHTNISDHNNSNNNSSNTHNVNISTNTYIMHNYTIQENLFDYGKSVSLMQKAASQLIAP